MIRDHPKTQVKFQNENSVPFLLNPPRPPPRRNLAHTLDFIQHARIEKTDMRHHILLFCSCTFDVIYMIISYTNSL